MLRVHFTAGDLARTRVADGPDALWETVLSLQRLQEKRVEPRLAEWRRHVLRHGAPALRLLRQLAPVRGYVPDFLTPPESSAGFEKGLEALLSTPRSRLREEIGRLTAAAPCSPGAWVRSLAEGEASALRALEDALRAYWGAAFSGSSWDRVCAAVQADRSLRARVQWRRGTEAMLGTFGPCLRWRPPVLECASPVTRDIRLGGRGLLLVPSYFCRRTPVTPADPSLPPTLVYPARVAAAPAAEYERGPVVPEPAGEVGTPGAGAAAGPHGATCPRGTGVPVGRGVPGGAGADRSGAAVPGGAGGPAGPGGAAVGALGAVAVGANGADPARSRLARLVGHTRAAVLQSVGRGCTTTELARRAGVSVSSASEHAAVLRGAGLISSGRERNTVRHILTPVGLALLEGRPRDVLPAAASALTPAAGGSEYALP